MSFSGELASLSITDLLQNLENNGQTGTLGVEGPRGRAWLRVEDGRITALARDGRPPLVESLVPWGVLSAEQLAAVKAKRRGSRRSLVETIENLGLASGEQVREVAHMLLVEEVCELVMEAAGEFTFQGGDAPTRVFDTEERRLRLAIAPSALLLEAASRSDHWKLARAVIPSMTVRFLSLPEPTLPAHLEDTQLAAQLLGLLDGTRDVEELLACFPGRHLDAFQVLGVLVRSHVVQAVEADGILELATSLRDQEPERARKLVASGLSEQPLHTGLLELEGELASRLNDAPGAAEARKRLAHVELENGRHEVARRLLDEARKLVPGDTAVCERLFALDLEYGTIDQAVGDGLELVQLYRAPGLHEQACTILERLVALRPSATELRIELAQSQIDAGNVRAAVRGLLRQGKNLVSREEYKAARMLYERVLRVDSNNKDATHAIEMIDTEAFRRRRARRRQNMRRALVLLCAGAFVLGVLVDARARVDLALTTRGVLEAGLIEERRYDEAISRYREVVKRHTYTPTALLEIPSRIHALEARRSHKP